MKKYLPLTIIILAIAAFFILDLQHYLSFEFLKQNQQALITWRNNNFITSIMIFMLTYIIIVTLSIPGATIATLAGGFLFGPITGTILVVISATIGACFIFLATRYALGDTLAKKAGPWLEKLKAGLEKNAFNYLLTLRLIPLFPFWVLNIAPALLNMRLRAFFLATLIGIIPGSAVYVSVGNGLSTIFESGTSPNLGIIFTPQILIPLLALAALAILPIIYKRIKKS